jgi:Tol biopolymer transport system component
VPDDLERLIRRCLEKDPDRRWQSAEALREALRWQLESGSGHRAAAADRPVASRSWRSRWTSAALFALAAAACAGAGWLAASLSHRAPVGLSMLTDLDLPADLPVGFDSVLAIAPDGKSVVFNSGQALWLRSLQDGTVRRLGGTAGGTLPFWSPSSRAIAFFADGHLQRLNLPDGSPVVLAPAPSARGGAWSARGVIVFAPALAGPLLRIAEDGGTTSEVTALDPARQEVTHQFPSFVPGEERFVFFAGSRVPQLSSIRMTAATDSTVGPAPPVSPQPFQSAAVVADTPLGPYLLSVRDSELVAQSFDVDRGLVNGPARTLARRVRPQFSVMSTGAIVYIVDPDVRNQPFWVDRDGRTIGPAGGAGSYQDLELSHQETKAAYVGAAEAGGAQGIWVLDLITGSTTRLRVAGVPDDPTWSPDGRQLAMSLLVEGVREEDVYITELARTDRPRKLIATPAVRWPLDWSADGRLILYAEIHPQTNYDIWVAPADGSGPPTAVVRGPAKDQGARFSPDGKWIAYQSNETGVSRVYVTDVTGSAARTLPVSAGEGNRPRWRADGREIFYQAPDRNLMVVPIAWGPAGPVPGRPRVLFRSSGRFEPAAMGQKFLVLQDAASPDVARVHLLTGWQQKPE